MMHSYRGDRRPCRCPVGLFYTIFIVYLNSGFSYERVMRFTSLLALKFIQGH